MATNSQFLQLYRAVDASKAKESFKTVQIRIVEESMETLTEYEKISIAFWVRSRFLVNRAGASLTLKEVSVDPYYKDYDIDDQPQSWPVRFDTSNWAVFAAFDGELRVGGAVAAWKTPALGLLGSREDLISLSGICESIPPTDSPVSGTNYLRQSWTEPESGNALKL